MKNSIDEQLKQLEKRWKDKSLHRSVIVCDNGFGNYFTKLVSRDTRNKFKGEK